MSEEEKEAIEQLNKRYKFLKRNNQVVTDIWLTLDVHNLGILLNISDKLQKEIEDLKEKNRHCINKSKIEKKIYELEEQMQQDEVDEFGIHSISWGALDYVVEQLKELLEENKDE